MFRVVVDPLTVSEDEGLAASVGVGCLVTGVVPGVTVVGTVVVCLTVIVLCLVYRNVVARDF